MRYIGIDMAQERFAVHIPEAASFSCANTPEGFQELFRQLLPGDILGVESTSNYHHRLAVFLLEHGFVVKELNPILTKQFIRATIRKKKTDKTDAEIISKLLAQGEGHQLTTKNLTNHLKKLARVKLQLTHMRSSLKVQLRALEGSAIDTTSLKSSYQKLIQSFTGEIEQIAAEMEEVETEETKILESIPGVSRTTARSILAEIGDVQKFDDKKKLVAYAGYDPVLAQSGKTLHHTGKLSKRGTPYLRNALYYAVFANIRSDNVFSRYYHKKRREGKHFTAAIVATSRKMLEIIYALLQKRQSFQSTPS